MIATQENTNDNSGIEGESLGADLGSLSDDEFLALDPNEFLSPQSSDFETEEVTSDEETGGAVSEEPSEGVEEGEDSTFDEEEEEVGTDNSPDSDPQDPYSDDQSVQDEIEEEEPEQEEPSDEESSPEAELEKALSPLRASGKTIQPKSVDELRRLAQMGYDYGRKVAALKPQQKLVQTFEKNQLTLEDINYLVDLRKGNPEAIRKLIKDNNIDPMDLSDDEGAEYRPTDHSVTDEQVAVNEVIREIASTPSYDDMVERVKTLDTASKQALQREPSALRTLNDHVDIGIYDEIMAEVEHKRALGELTGLSDLVAYDQVGAAMQAAGAFDKFQQQAPETTRKSQSAAQDSGSSSPKKSGENLRNRKKAAGTPRGKAPTGKQKVDLSRLSDEEIMKLDPSSL
jgi:hypothetical protein